MNIEIKYKSSAKNGKIEVIVEKSGTEETRLLTATATFMRPNGRGEKYFTVISLEELHAILELLQELRDAVEAALA